MQEVPALQALLRFVRFGLPWDFGRTITIARGDACPAVTIRGRGALWEGRAGKATRAPRVAAPPRGRQAAQREARDFSNRNDGFALRLRGERRGKRQSPQPSPAPRQRGHVTVRSAMWEKGMPAIPRPQENEGVGEHVRTRFHVGPKAACEIAEPLGRRTAPNEENLFLLPDRTLASEPAKENDPTVGLMSRRHPLSPTRTC
ncbi:hypothetical protein ABIC08_008160 [Bradyrhizobium sp. RT9b]